MMSALTINISDTQRERRRFLINATSSFGAIGVGALLVPFIASMKPSERTKVAGASIEVDVSKLQLGEQVTVLWRGKPVWVLHRTPKMLERLSSNSLLQKLSDPDSEVLTQQPDFAINNHRALRPKYFVTIALCTHLGCVPNFRPETSPDDLGAAWLGGYYCPCHGSRFDLAGRVFKGVPAPTNLEIPPYQFLSDTVIEIGTSRSS